MAAGHSSKKLCFERRFNFCLRYNARQCYDTYLGTTCTQAVGVVQCRQVWSKGGKDGACPTRTTGTGPDTHQWFFPGARRHRQAPGGCTDPWTQSRTVNTRFLIQLSRKSLKECALKRYLTNPANNRLCWKLAVRLSHEVNQGSSNVFVRGPN